MLSTEYKKRVIVVDTSNEIAGEGNLPHPAVGLSRRMQVPFEKAQYQIMIEAVENHMPEVIIIDEIGTQEETAASRTIAERGVQLIGTAHGNTLDNVLFNPTISDLLGGITSVILSDEESIRRGTQKTVTNLCAKHRILQRQSQVLSWSKNYSHSSSSILEANQRCWRETAYITTANSLLGIGQSSI